MSLLTPVKVPVKVYRWDDAGAPALDKTAGCMMTIFKACLVTGYGTKEPAGWTMPFEDTVAGVKVFRPEVTPNIDFYLRMSADTGTEVVSQAYVNMIDANTGDLKLQCSTPFKYAKTSSSGNKWILIASTRGVWFFNDQNSSLSTSKKGVSFFLGDTVGGITDRPVYMHHSGGFNNNDDRCTYLGYPDTYEGRFTAGKLLLEDMTVATTNMRSFVNGDTVLTAYPHITPVFVIHNGDLFLIPAAYTPLNGGAKNNLDVIDTMTESVSKMVVFGTGGNRETNAYTAIDYWVY